MVWDGHLLEGDLLGVLEVRVWVPDFFEPVNGKKPVVAGLVLHFPVKPQPLVPPALGEENVGSVRLSREKHGTGIITRRYFRVGETDSSYGCRFTLQLYIQHLNMNVGTCMSNITHSP